MAKVGVGYARGGFGAGTVVEGTATGAIWSFALGALVLGFFVFVTTQGHLGDWLKLFFYTPNSGQAATAAPSTDNSKSASGSQNDGTYQGQSSGWLAAAGAALGFGLGGVPGAAAGGAVGSLPIAGPDIVSTGKTPSSMPQSMGDFMGRLNFGLGGTNK